MKKTKLGFLKKGDEFFFKDRKYRVNLLLRNTNGYVNCTDISTHTVTRLHIDIEVEV